MDVLDRLDRLQYIWHGSSITLNPPATAAQLETAESAIGVRLPDDVRRAYLRFNGTSRRSHDETTPPGPHLFFLPFCDWVSLEAMVELWELMRGINEQLIRRGTWPDIHSTDEAVWGTPEDRACRRSECVGWLPQWVPVGDYGQHDKVYIDLAPTERGVVGQIICTAEDTLVTEVIATSFSEYLDRFLTGIETGRLLLRRGDPHWYCPDRSTPVWELSDIGLGPNLPALAPAAGTDSPKTPAGVTIGGMPAIETTWRGGATSLLPLTIGDLDAQADDGPEHRTE